MHYYFRFVSKIQKDGTIGNDLVIKPVPSSIKLQQEETSDPITNSASTGSSSSSSIQFKTGKEKEEDQRRRRKEDSSSTPSSAAFISFSSILPSSSPTSSAARSMIVDDGRDDDELFLDQDDDVSVKDLTHLKKRNKKSNTGFNLNNKKKGVGAAASSSRQQEQESKRTTTIQSSSTEDRYSYDNYHVPKLSKLREEEDEKKDLRKLKVAHIIYKKKKVSHEQEHHSDYMPLEPGHMYTASMNKGSVDLHSSFPSNYSLVRPRNENTNNNNNGNSSNTAHRRSKRQSPDTVWPEVLLVVDYDSYLLHGGNSRDVKRYFISFWNGVDLRYKLLTHPRIRVSLAGMIVAKVSYCLLLLLFIYPFIIILKTSIVCSLLSFLILFFIIVLALIF